MPERTRAIRIPSERPETTIERAAARLCGGAKSPTRGSINCGVTVVTEQIKEIAVNVARLFVMQSPILRLGFISNHPHADMIWKEKVNQRKKEPAISIRKQYMETYHSVAVKNMSEQTKARLLSKSPSGHRNSSPTAYPACMTVGI